MCECQFSAWDQVSDPSISKTREKQKKHLQEQSHKVWVQPMTIESLVKSTPVVKTQKITVGLIPVEKGRAKPSAGVQGKARGGAQTKRTTPHQQRVRVKVAEGHPQHISGMMKRAKARLNVADQAD